MKKLKLLLRGNLLKDRYSFIAVLCINIVLFLIGFLAGDFLPGFAITRESAKDIQKDILSDYISLLSLGLAVLAVLLAIIQFAYKRINIIRLVISATFFAPVVYFGLLNILISALNYLYHNDSRFVPDWIFARIAVIETYLFAVSCTLVAFVFFRTFTFASFSKITDLYLSNIKRIVILEKKKNLDDDDAEFLTTAASELKSEMDESIKDSKLPVISKVFDLYAFILSENPLSNIFRGFRISLQNWMLEAQKNRDYVILNKLVESWRELYQNALRSRDTNQIDVLMLFVNNFYRSFHGEQGQAARKLVIENFPIRLKEIGLVQIWGVKNQGDIENLLKAYTSMFPILQEFNELIKSTIEARDTEGLQTCLQELKNLVGDPDIAHTASEIRMNIKLAEIGVPGYQVPVESLLQRLQLHEDLSQRKLAIVFGNLSWIYYQILQGKMTLDQQDKLIELLLEYIPQNNRELLFSVTRILNDDSDQFKWEQWIWKDEMRLSGEAYFLPHNQLFLAVGLITILLRKGLESAQAKDFEDSIALEIATIRHWIEEAIKAFKHHETIWSTIIKIPAADFQQQLSKIAQYFMEFEKVKEKVEQLNLAAAPISPVRVNDFRETISEQWNSTNTLSRVFEYEGAVVRNPEGKLQHVGMMRIHFEKAKFLFTEIQHRKIYGIEWGHEVNTAVNNLFLTRIKEAEIPTIRADSYVDVLDNLPKEIIDGENNNIIVFHSFISSYVVLRDLENTGNFKSASQFTGESFPFEFTGVYRNNIILVPLRTNSLKDRLIVTKLHKAILLKRRENEEWIGGLLQVDVIEIDRENAERLAIKKYPGKEITQELLNEMLSGVFVEINETMDFEIIDKKKIAMYLLNHNTELDLE